MTSLAHQLFQKLPESIQLHFLNEHGILLLDRRTSSDYFCLYAVDDFFIETRFENEGSRFVLSQIFTSGAPLEEYLTLIEIDQLVN